MSIMSSVQVLVQSIKTHGTLEFQSSSKYLKINLPFYCRKETEKL